MDGQFTLLHGEADVEAGEGEAVDSARLALVAGAGVVDEDADGGGALFGGELIQQGFGEIDLENKFVGGIGEAAQGVGVGICVGDVGLDVENGGAVHQVRAGDMDDGSVVLCEFHALQLHAAQAQIVGPEGGAGGEDAHAGIAAEPRRADRGGPAGADGLGKLPDDPKMGKALKPPEGVGVAVFRLEDDGGAQVLDQVGLAGNAEFGGEIAAHTRDHVNGNVHIYHSLPTIISAGGKKARSINEGLGMRNSE